MARDDGEPLSSVLGTLFGRCRSVFFSRLHARVLPHLTAIGPLRNLRIHRGVQEMARQVRLLRWHKPRTGFFGWEARMVSIDSTALSSSATGPNLAASSESIL
jgi:hypothetical protein